MMGRMYAPKPKCNDTDYIDFLIASPKAQDKASCRLKLAHWKWPDVSLGTGR